MVKIFGFASNTRVKNIDVEDLGDIEYFLTDPIADVWPVQMRIQLLANKVPQDYFPVGPLRLVSSRFMRVCREFNVNAEFLPVRILEKDSTESQLQYFFCHLLDNVDCFDFKKSKCTYRDNKTRWIDEIIELVIDDEKASGHHLFRVAVSKFIIAASDQFAEAVQRLQLSGTVFTEPREWRGVSS